MKGVDFSMYHQFFCTFLIAWVIFINSKKELTPPQLRNNINFLSMSLFEKEMATHSSILAWKKSHGQKKPHSLQSTGSQSQTRLRDFTITDTMSL